MEMHLIVSAAQPQLQSNFDAFVHHPDFIGVEILVHKKKQDDGE